MDELVLCRYYAWSDGCEQIVQATVCTGVSHQ